MRNKRFTRQYYLLLIPGFLWLLLFSIIPMFGIVMAFQDFNPGKGIFGSPFIGLDNFRYMLKLKDVKSIFFNTVFISMLKIVANLAVPMIFALLLNELRYKKLAKPIQTIVYLPHFISWVVFASILLNIFGYNGPINTILSMFGVDPVLFWGRPNLFPYLVAGTDVWKEFGYNTIIYLAALTGIDPGLHEAAALDGAGRFRRLLHITLPGIKTTVILLVVLSLRNVLNAGFDQIFILYNPLVYSTGDIIDTWVYRMGILNMQYSLSTAVGLLKSVVSLILISTSYFLAKKFAGYNLF